MKSALQIIAACQSVIARFLPPDGIREDFALQKLIEILDGPEAVALTMTQPGLESALSEDQLLKVSGPALNENEIMRRMAHRREVAKMLTGKTATSGIAQAPKPTIGRIVRVILSLELSAAINRDPRIGGNATSAGEAYPFMITRVWPETTYADGMTVNGQLMLDGPNNHWMTSVHYGDAPDCWHWPEIISPAAELTASQERERQLSERLASIAALTTGL